MENSSAAQTTRPIISLTKDALASWCLGDGNPARGANGCGPWTTHRIGSLHYIVPAA